MRRCNTNVRVREDGGKPTNTVTSMRMRLLVKVRRRRVFCHQIHGWRHKPRIFGVLCGIHESNYVLNVGERIGALMKGVCVCEVGTVQIMFRAY